MRKQKFNIQLNMDFEEFRHLNYVFIKHGMAEAFKEGNEEKIDATERLERKLLYLYDMVKQSTDTDYNQEHDIIEIDKNGCRYKKLK